LRVKCDPLATQGILFLWKSEVFACVGLFQNLKDLSDLVASTPWDDSQRLEQPYRVTSLIRNTPLLGPYSRTIPRVVWWS